MSSYLACFIVSDFASQSKTVRGVLEGGEDFEMRVFSTKAQLPKVEYALDIGVGITEYYIEYFNITYPLPKLGKLTQSATNKNNILNNLL